MTVAQNGPGSALLRWTAPLNNGGTAITHYEYRINGAASWTEVVGNSTIITGLVNGDDYVFGVKAVNSVGDGPEEDASQLLLIADPPNAPALGVTRVANSATELELNWNAPTNNGSSVTGYQYNIDGGAWVDESSRSVTVASLTRGGRYDFQVRAKNARGWGPPSIAVPGIPAVKPAQVSGVTGTPSSRQITLNWSAPSHNGGLPIIKYEYQTGNAGAWTSMGVATQYTVTGLDNGTSYTFKVRAVNDVGNGNASAQSAAAIPEGEISSPTNFSVARFVNSVQK